MSPAADKDRSDSKKTTSEKNPKSPTSNRSSKRKIKRFRPNSPPSPLTLPQKIIVFLEDNRISPGDTETLRSLRRINDHSQNVRLKKVLNVVFLSTGVALLLSVIGVIIFTSLVNDESMAPSNTDPVSDDVYGRNEMNDRISDDQPNHLPIQQENSTEEHKPVDKDFKYSVEKGNLEMLIPRGPGNSTEKVIDNSFELQSGNIRHRNRKDCTLVPIQRGTKLRMLDICGNGKRHKHK